MEEKKQKKIAKEEDLTDQRHDVFVFAFGHKSSPNSWDMKNMKRLNKICYFETRKTRSSENNIAPIIKQSSKVYRSF